MEGEENVEEMLDLFIKDTMDELAGIRDAFPQEIIRSWGVSYTKPHRFGK